MLSPHWLSQQFWARVICTVWFNFKNWVHQPSICCSICSQQKSAWQTCWAPREAHMSTHTCTDTHNPEFFVLYSKAREPRDPYLVLALAGWSALPRSRPMKLIPTYCFWFWTFSRSFNRNEAERLTVMSVLTSHFWRCYFFLHQQAGSCKILKGKNELLAKWNPAPSKIAWEIKMRRD